MAVFKYKAVAENGSEMNGTLQADSLSGAENLLVAKGMIPLSLREEQTSSGPRAHFSDRFAKITTPELILFTKQFRTMFQAGVSVTALLQILSEQAENPKLRQITSQIQQDIKSGYSLHECLRRHPKVFSSLYCSMIRAGEVSGSLPEVMNRLTHLLEHEHKISTDIKSALQYPKIVVVALGVAFFVLLYFVIPKFVRIFESAGLTLPLPTKVCIMLYNFMHDYWYIMIGGGLGLFFLMRYWLKSTSGRLLFDALKLKIPIVGPVLRKAAMSRFASIFAILQASGVSVLESMSILSGTIGNSAIAAEFDRVNNQLQEGRGISGPLKAAHYFTPMVISMVAIGEESGNLDEMLRQISKHYDEEVEYAVSRMATAIGPMLMVGLAGVVGFFALAIFLPMWDLTKMAHQ